MRAFIGLAVPDVLAGPLMQLQGAVPVGRAVPSDDLHVTLAFLGEVPEEAIEDVHEALDGRSLQRATISPDTLSTYGGTPPRLLAMGLRADPSLLALHKQVARAVDAAGLRLARRRFRPHITLVRFGNGLSPPGQARLHRALSDLAVPALPSVEARVAHLYRSHLGPGGARYETLADYLLR
ncbi:MAG: RNA 2',3'-cyclic phosphodiesterase [Pseudomonadota bacterium]